MTTDDNAAPNTMTFINLARHLRAGPAGASLNMSFGRARGLPSENEADVRSVPTLFGRENPLLAHLQSPDESGYEIMYDTWQFSISMTWSQKEKIFRLTTRVCLRLSVSGIYVHEPETPWIVIKTDKALNDFLEMAGREIEYDDPETSEMYTSAGQLIE